MTLTTTLTPATGSVKVSDACQINDFDHSESTTTGAVLVSDACQINDFDH